MGKFFGVLGHSIIIALIWGISIHRYVDDRADGISCGYYLMVAAILTVLVIGAAYVLGVYYGYWILGMIMACSLAIYCWGNCNAYSRSEHEKRSNREDRREH